MWYIEHTLETLSEPKVVWYLWKDVKRWVEWNENLDWAKLSGLFMVGGTISVKPKGRRQQHLKVVELDEGRGFTCKGRKFLASFRLIHHVEPSPLGCRITQRIEMEGLLAWWFRLVMERRLRETLPSVVRKLAHLAGKG